MNSVSDCLKNWKSFIPGGEVWDDNIDSNINENGENVDQMDDNINNENVNSKERKETTNIDSNATIIKTNRGDMIANLNSNVKPKRLRLHKRKLPKFVNIIIDFMNQDKSETFEKVKQLIPGIEALDDNFLPSTTDNTKNNEDINEIDYSADVVHVKRRKPSTFDSPISKLFRLIGISSFKNIKDRIHVTKERQEFPMEVTLYAGNIGPTSDADIDITRNIDITTMDTSQCGQIQAEDSELSTRRMLETTSNKISNIKTNEIENAVNTLENLFNDIENKESANKLYDIRNQNTETLCDPAKIDVQYELSVKYGNVAENYGQFETGFLVYAYSDNSETDLHKEKDSDSNGLGTTAELLTKPDVDCSEISTLYCNGKIGENSKSLVESKSFKLKNNSNFYKIVEEIESRSKLALGNSNSNLKRTGKRYKNSMSDVIGNVVNLEEEPLAQKDDIVEQKHNTKTKTECSENEEKIIIDVTENVSDDIFCDIDTDTIETKYYPVNSYSPRYQHVHTLAEMFEEVAVKNL